MAITVNLDAILHDRRMSLTLLADLTGVSIVNLSKLKTGKVRAIRFSTLDAVCRVLACQPGDILAYQGQEQPDSGDANAPCPVAA